MGFVCLFFVRLVNCLGSQRGQVKAGAGVWEEVGSRGLEEVKVGFAQPTF